MHLDLTDLIQTIGYIGIFAIIFSESGILLGFFLPGDSLLFTAGFLASQGLLSLPVLVIGCFIAAVAGDSVGYAFGNKVGVKLFQKEDSLFFHKKNLIKTQEFYEKHGAKTIVLARFIPFIRTFAPIVAGIGSMHYSTFIKFNILGGILWAIGLNLAGYFLGSLIPDVDKYLIPIVLGIMFVSVLPPMLHVIKDPEAKAAIVQLIKNIFKKK